MYLSDTYQFCYIRDTWRVASDVMTIDFFKGVLSYIRLTIRVYILCVRHVLVSLCALSTLYTWCVCLASDAVNNRCQEACYGAERQCLLGKQLLVSGVDYVFRLAAHNAMGWSPFSDASAAFQSPLGDYHVLFILLSFVFGSYCLQTSFIINIYNTSVEVSYFVR